MRPQCFSVRSTRASTSSLREMLHGMTSASPPALRIAAATSSQASALRLETTTLAPSDAMISDAERPMPRLDPVMMATWPERSNGFVMAGRLLRMDRYDWVGIALRTSRETHRPKTHPAPQMMPKTASRWPAATVSSKSRTPTEIAHSLGRRRTPSGPPCLPITLTCCQERSTCLTFGDHRDRPNTDTRTAMGEERPWPWERSYPPGVRWDAALAISTLPQMLDAFTAQ